MRNFIGQLIQVCGILWIIFFGLMAVTMGVAATSDARLAWAWILPVVLALPGAWMAVKGRRIRRAANNRTPQRQVVQEQVLETVPSLRATLTVERRESASGEMLLPLREVEHEFDALNQKHRYFKAEAATWVVPLIAQMQNEMAVRSHGGDLTKEQKKILGLSARARFGSLYIESLTPEGLAYAQDAAALYVHSIGGAISRRQSIQQFKSMGIKRIRLCATRDDRTCKAALVADNHRFATASAPTLPLEGCNAEYCRCLWIADIN